MSSRQRVDAGARYLRKNVEMLFAHLKLILKLDRLQLGGPCGACDKFRLAAAQNLRKLRVDPRIGADQRDRRRHDARQTLRHLSTITIPISQEPTSSTQSTQSVNSFRPPTPRTVTNID
jgi:hypothetical protein